MQFGEDAIVNEQEQEEETEADFSVTTYKVTMSEALKCVFLSMLRVLCGSTNTTW